MYFLPVYITKYKTKIEADCFVRNIRANTMDKYDQDGYIKQSNPRGLICRNEKEKAIILKEKPFYNRSTGGTTAVFVAESKGKDELTVTVIAYHDWGGTIWNVLFIFAGVYSLISGENLLIGLAFIAFILIMNSFDTRDLKRQKELIEMVIADCEQLTA